MKRFLMVCAIFPLVLSAAITGQWRATATNVVTTGSPLPQTVGIYATLTQTGSTVTGTAGVNGKSGPIQNVVLSGSSVSFDAPDGATGTAHFVLTDSGAPTLAGQVKLAGGQVLPVTFSSVK